MQSIFHFAGVTDNFIRRMKKMLQLCFGHEYPEEIS